MFKLFTGLKDKKTRKQEISTADALEIVRGYLDTIKQDATIYTARGLYTHEDGGRVSENTIIIELMFIEHGRAVEIARALKIALNQESIALQMIETEGDLI